MEIEAEGPERSVESSPGTASKRRYAPLLFGVLLLAGVIFVAANIGQGRKFLHLIRESDPFCLLIALIFQVATYPCTAAVWHIVLHRFGVKASLDSLSALSLAKLFFDKMVPVAGIGGFVLMVRSLETRGASSSISTAAMLVEVFSIYAARALAVGASVVILWLKHGFDPVITGASLLFGVFAAAVLVGVVWLTGIEAGSFPGWVFRTPGIRKLARSLVETPSEALRSRHLLLQAVLLQLSVIVLDVATLAVLLRALGYTERPEYLFAAFTLALVASTMSLIPAGLGVFEGVSVLVLGIMDVPIEAALASTLLLRAYTLWLPMLPGLLIFRKESRHLLRS